MLVLCFIHGKVISEIMMEKTTAEKTEIKRLKISIPSGSTATRDFLIFHCKVIA